MKKINVFVFPCGSEIGLELFRALCFSKEINLVGGSSVPDHGKFVYDHYLSDIPFVTEATFLQRITEVIRECHIDYILPAHDSILLQLAEFQHQGALLCRVLTSPIETCRITRSKKQTMEVFEGIIRTPQVYNDIRDVREFPVFLKPDVGQGSKETKLANSKEE